MIFLWSADLEELLGPSALVMAKGRGGSALPFGLLSEYDRKVTRNAVFVRDVAMLELYYQSRTFA